MDTNEYLHGRLNLIRREIEELGRERRIIEAILKGGVPLLDGLRIRPEDNRRGLRGRGRTREIFQFLACHKKGVAFSTLVEAVEPSGNSKKVQRACRVAQRRGYLGRLGGRYVLTALGEALLERSAAYSGEACTSRYKLQTPKRRSRA